MLFRSQNVRLEESQAGIKTAGRNINNLRYADDTTLMAESEEELKSLLMKEKEEREKVGLKPNIQKTKIMASSPITSWQIDGETMEIVRDFILGGSEITADGDCGHDIKRHLLLERKAMTNLDSILSNKLALHTGVSGHSFVQGILLTQGSNPGLLHCRQILYLLSHQGKSFSQSHLPILGVL